MNTTPFNVIRRKRQQAAISIRHQPVLVPAACALQPEEATNRALPGRRVRSRTVAALVVAAATLCGCQSLSYTSPGGERFTRTSLGAKLTIGSLAVSTGTNGVRTIELRGYENDSAQTLSALTEAAIRAALAGLATHPVTP